ncbi:MAG: amidase [Rhodobacteraceae bacterium]|nr:amidase [Paracoccaceae bacterium]
MTCLTAVDAAERIRSGSLKSEDLVSDCLQRIEATDCDLGAWVHLNAEDALNQAREMDRLRWFGRPVGSLHGVPIGIKDIIDTGGIPTERGTKAYAGRVPRRDAFIIDRLRDAGAVILGKTVTTEMAFMCAADTRNPHDRTRTPGGSSSGSAAAVAAAQVPLAIGTQTNGSVIRPAAFCGVFGFKPSRGAVSRTGVLRTSESLDQVGVFARSLEDVAALADAIAGRDSTDAGTHSRPRPRYLDGCRSEAPIEPTIAWMQEFQRDRLADDARQGMEDVAALLGPHVERIPLPPGFMRLMETHRVVQDYEIGRNLKRLAADKGALLSRQLRATIDRGQAIGRKEYRRALEGKAAAERYFEKFFYDYDAILAPSALGEAPPFESGTGDPCCCTAWTLCGLPTLSLPILTGAGGLPVGVQLIGGPDEDDRLLRTANWILRRLVAESGSA